MQADASILATVTGASDLQMYRSVTPSEILHMKQLTEPEFPHKKACEIDAINIVISLPN